jgi:hypothetical protein
MMNQLTEVIHYVRGLQIDPLVLVCIAALLAALIQQRMARAHTPDFSNAYRDLDGKALKTSKPRASPTTYHD